MIATFSALLLFSLLLVGVRPGWTEVTQLLAPTLNATILSVHRDPSSSLNHLVLGTSLPSQYIHMAVTDDAKIVAQSAFADRIHRNAILRSAGDGSRLFLAFDVATAQGGYAIVFVESSNSGKTWSSPLSAVKFEVAGSLSDLLFVPETGRLFVFFTTYPGYELRMVSRAPGSAVFSAETRVAREAYHGYRSSAKAGYSTLQSSKAAYIHVAYRANGTDLLMYVRSDTNGVTWSSPKMVGDRILVDYVATVVSGPKFRQAIFISYVAPGGSRLVLYSSDLGEKFSEQLHMSKMLAPRWNQAGVTSCANADGSLSMLVSFIPGDGRTAPEYSLWDTLDMRQYARRNPFGKIRARQTGVDCVIDSVAKLRKTVVFATMWEQETCRLYMAVESEVIPAV